jgi:hypothetical protein
MWLSRFHLASQVFSLNNNYNYSNYKQRELKAAFPHNSQKNYRNYNLSGSFSPLIIDVYLCKLEVNVGLLMQSVLDEEADGHHPKG